MPVFHIGDRVIGDGQPCYIIAEVGLNHNGDVELAKQLTDIAVEAGADAVKFQKRSLVDTYVGGYLENPQLGQQSLQYLIPILKEFELSDDQMADIAEYCGERGITFLCTPWDKPSADAIERMGAPAFKAASADMTNFDLLEYLVEKGKPLIVSTGMSTVEEIDATVAFLKERGANFALLHCSSNYPAAFHNINLAFMEVMRKRYDVVVGYSGHERGIAVSEAAVAMGAKIIERHFTLDRTMRGPDHAASLEPPGLQKLIRDIRNIELAIGSKKRWLSRGEFANRQALGKSLVSTRDVRKGEKISRSDVCAKSPGTGVSPQRLYDLVGRTATRDIPADSFFTPEDLGEKPFELPPIQNKRKWGVVVRFSDMKSVLRATPPLVEVHLTEGDVLDHPPDIDDYEADLSVHTPEYVGDDLLDPVSDSRRIRDLTRDAVQRGVDVARAIKKHFRSQRPIFVMHPGGAGRNPKRAEAKRYLDRLFEFVQSLDAEGVELVVENMPPLPWYYGGQWFQFYFCLGEEIGAFCEETGVRTCLDVSHAALAANYHRRSLADFIEAVSPYTAHVHIADAAGVDGEGLQIGDGEIDFRSVLRQLAPLDCAIVAEIWQGHLNGGQGFWEAVYRLEQML